MCKHRLLIRLSLIMKDLRKHERFGFCSLPNLSFLLLHVARIYVEAKQNQENPLLLFVG